MRYAITLTLLSLCAFSARSFAAAPADAATGSGDSLSAGIGIGYVPEYAGSDKDHVVPVPFLERTWDNGAFISSRRGAGWGTTVEGISLSAALSYDGGRDDHKRNFSAGSDDLRGMGKIDGSAQVVLSAGYQVGTVALSVSTRQNLGHRDYGASYTLGASMPLYTSASDQLGLGVSALYGDDKHAQTWFGVTAAQSASSGYKQYTPKAGFEQVTAGVNWNHVIDKQWSVLTALGVNQLTGDAADSPLTKRKTAPMLVTGFNYKF